VNLYYYPVTLGFVDLVIARRPRADVAISYPSKVEAVPPPKRLTMMPTVSIVTEYYNPSTSRFFCTFFTPDITNLLRLR